MRMLEHVAMVLAGLSLVILAVRLERLERRVNSIQKHLDISEREA